MSDLEFTRLEKNWEITKPDVRGTYNFDDVVSRGDDDYVIMQNMKTVRQEDKFVEVPLKEVPLEFLEQVEKRLTEREREKESMELTNKVGKLSQLVHRRRKMTR